MVKLGNFIIFLLQIFIEFVSILITPLTKIWGKNQICILCYHRVCDLHPQIGGIIRDLTVTPKAFDQQMNFLSKNGFNVITLDQYFDYKHKNIRPPKRSIVITFDDGYSDNYINAFKVLKKYNFKATFFIVTDYINSDRIFSWLKIGDITFLQYDKEKEYLLPLSKKAILEMDAYGATFGSHTKTHCYLTQINKNQIIDELRGSKEQLEKILAKPVKYFCFPHGDMNDFIKKQVKEAGYKAALALKGGTNSLKSDPFELRRILILSQDSLYKFKRKVEGGYDWWDKYLLPVAIFLKGVISRRVKCVR